MNNTNLAEETSYNLIMLQNPILVSDEKLMINDICYGVDINNGWVETVHSAGSHDVAHKHPKLIAGLAGYPSVDLSDEVADIIAKETGWIDVEKLAIKKFPYSYKSDMGDVSIDFIRRIWVQCFKETKSLNEKNFSEEDMIKAMTNVLTIIAENKPLDLDIMKSICAELAKPKVYIVQLEMEKMLQKRWGTEWHDLPNQKEGRDFDGIYQNVIRPKNTNNKYKVIKIIK